MASLRILIADEHYLKRYGLKSLLEGHPGWTICAEASTGSEAASLAKRLKPDIAILDISMPELNGLEATKKIRADSPNTEILILSVHYSQQLIQEILDAGARGYILESDSDRDLVTAVETIANHELFPIPLTPGAVDLPSTVTSADQADIEGMQLELAELIALVQQPFRQQLVGISEGEPDDPSVQDYIMEELFAVAVRSCKMDDRISEPVAHFCWKIFTYLAPSKYDGLTPTTMAQLMSHMSKNLPQRYNGDLHTSSFLSVDLLSHSDKMFGTNYAENLRDSLCRFSHLISKIQGIPPSEKESGLRQMEEVSESRHPIHANLWAPEESQYPMEETPKMKQVIAAEEDGAPRSSVLHDVLSTVLRTLQLAIERVSAGLRTFWRRAIAVFSRISPSLQKVKRWLNTPMK
jgi:DNA-binding NarL/FixJ family response regulator